MQFVMQDPEWVTVRSERPALVDQRGNTVREKERRVYARFQRGGLPPYAAEIARSAFAFKNLQIGETVEMKAGFYDSEADQLLNSWTPEERAAIEHKLLTDTHGCLLVEKPRLLAPWPAIESMRPGGRGKTAEGSAKQLAETAETIGVPLSQVIAYLQQEGWPDSVLSLLEALEDSDPGDEDEPSTVQTTITA